VGDARDVKAVERTTNHDVKAIEYVLKERFAADPQLAEVGRSGGGGRRDCCSARCGVCAAWCCCSVRAGTSTAVIKLQCKSPDWFGPPAPPPPPPGPRVHPLCLHQRGHQQPQPRADAEGGAAGGAAARHGLGHQRDRAVGGEFVGGFVGGFGGCGGCLPHACLPASSCRCTWTKGR
jgi:hypothetical protein